MAKSRNQRILDALRDRRYGPEIEAAFLASINLIRSEAQVRRITQLIAAGDVQGAITELRIDNAAFAAFNGSLAQSFNAGGQFGAQTMPKKRPNGQRFIIRFDAQNPAAESWLRNYSSTRITGIVDDTRNAVRNFLEAGLQRGDNPRTMALDIIGRIDKQTGRRVGGIIGLTEAQEGFVRNARDELAGLSTADLRNYLTRKTRDKRFDRYVHKAINDGVAIPADIQQKMLGRMKDSLLRHRGEMIGRTEAMTSLHKGRYQSFMQAYTSGEVSAEEIKRTWRTAGDDRVRETHEEMNGQETSLLEPYTLPDGGTIMFPGDPSADASEIINCRCDEDIRIDFLSRLR